MHELLKHGNILTIAEIGQAHDGSLGILHSYIDAVALSGVKAIKFQTHIADAESSEHEPFRVNFSYEDKTRFDYWKRMQFTLEQWREIKTHCDESGLIFVSSPFSNAAVDLLEEIGCPIYKIGSGETSNFLMLSRIASTGKPIILSTGMSSFSEIDEAVAFLKPFKNELSVLQCTTAYPTQPEQWGLNVIPELIKKYSHPIGFSDHSGEIYACLAAATLGAKVLEFHVTFDKRLFGPDSPASLDFEQTKSLLSGLSSISASLSAPIDKSKNNSFIDLKIIFEKSLAVNKTLAAGSTISADDLDAKKPKGYGISAKNYRSVVGKTLKTEKQQWDFLCEEDINED